MIAFVKEAEALLEKGQLERLKNDEGDEASEDATSGFLSDARLFPARVTQLVRGFSSSWKQAVEAMSQDVMRSFTNFKNGTSIIQVRTGGDVVSCHVGALMTCCHDDKELSVHCSEDVTATSSVLGTETALHANVCVQ